MIQKPEQYYDKRRHQLYYQWSESEYFSHQEPIYDRTREYIESLEAENAKLREMACVLHMAYVETLNECESVNEGLIWEYSGSIDDDIAKSKARFEVNRHRFDAALCELGVEVDE